MKLYVDDIREAPDDTWTVVRTVTEAIRAIARYDFEVISLDHDISHYSPKLFSDDGQLPRQEGVYVSCDETFAPVVYYLAEKYRGNVPLSPRIILHTSNQVAGEEMVHILGAAGIDCEEKYTGRATYSPQ